MHGLLAAAGARADAAVLQVTAALAARAAAIPGVVAFVAADGVMLQGRGLAARAFGGRRAAADPRLRALTQDLQRAGEQP